LSFGPVRPPIIASGRSVAIEFWIVFQLVFYLSYRDHPPFERTIESMYTSPAKRRAAGGSGSVSTPSARSVRGGAATPSRGSSRTPQAPPPQQASVPDGPISDFCLIIETTPAEDWQKRTAALSTLVAAIPTGSDYSLADPGMAWYNSPPTLRHLANPLSTLLKDARSTVVKRTCESTAELFAKCQVDARYLLKDIMPHILAVHAQTVQVIRSYVQTMVVDSLAVVPCKMAMPLWLDRLKSDKSRTVREACTLYLTVGLAEWDAYNESYLTPEIWTQVGTALIKSLRDPSQQTRHNAKRGLETIQSRKPLIFDALLLDTDLVKDLRIKRILAKIQSGDVGGDDLSVGSSRVGGGGGGASVSSRSVGISVSGRSQYSERYGGAGGRSPSQGGYGMRTGTAARGGIPMSSSASSSSRHAGIPTNIAVSSPIIVDPPRKVSSISNGSGRYANGTTGGSSRVGGGLGPPQRIVAAPFRGTETPTRVTSTARSTGVPSILNGGGGAKHDVVNLVTTLSFDSAESPVPVIANKTELLEVAAQRRQNSRRSSLLQERFARSSSALEKVGGKADNIEDGFLDDLLDAPAETGSSDDMDDDVLGLRGGDPPAKLHASGLGLNARNLNDPTSTGTTRAMVPRPRPEHVVIANEMLEAHKAHVDQIMETLKIEMDALKDFEQTLLDEETTPNATVVTEEEVLEYFESVGLCLDQRTAAGNHLRRAMDRISKGGGGG
jgi:hypothetical protein